MVLPYKGILYDTMSNMHTQGPNPMGRRNHCADFEINHVECLEAYGLMAGKERCVKYEEDLYECKTNFIKNYRARMMALERYKKIAKGELPFEKRKGDEPPYDSYITGTFSP